MCGYRGSMGGIDIAKVGVGNSSSGVVLSGVLSDKS